MANIIFYANDIADEFRRQRIERGEPTHNVWADVQGAAKENHPTYLGIIDSVNYIDKTDRYVVKFGGNTFKVTEEVAEFLLTENNNPSRRARPTIYAAIDKGVIVGVSLLFLNRD